MTTSREIRVQILVDDQASPALAKYWIGLVLTDEYVGSALAHEGIEPPEDVVARIAGDLRTKLLQSMAGAA